MALADWTATQKALLLTGIIGGFVVIVVVAVVVILVTGRASSSSSSSSRGSGATGSNTTPGIIAQGYPCSKISDCVTGTFCAENRTCVLGTARDIDSPCVHDRQCLVGTHCANGNICVEGTGKKRGETCTISNNCVIGYNCVSSSCSSSSSSTTSSPASTTGVKIPVYRTFKASRQQFIDSANPAYGSIFYPNSTPIWYGISASGTGRIPIYGWLNTNVGVLPGDWVWSKSNSEPFTGATNGYVIQNNGKPILYLYSSKINSEVLPIYRLLGFDPNYSKTYHTTQVNSTTLEAPDTGYGISYSSDDSQVTPLLGYGFVA